MILIGFPVTGPLAFPWALAEALAIVRRAVRRLGIDYDRAAGLEGFPELLAAWVSLEVDDNTFFAAAFDFYQRFPEIRLCPAH